MPESTLINVSDLPSSSAGFSKLFADYLSDFSKVQQFFEYDFHHEHNVLRRSEAIVDTFRHRDELRDILLRQNLELGAGDATVSNINAFGEQHTLAIVTGQQVGILGGPMYTIYKTLTAIKLARQYSKSFPQFRYVPVFWIEGEDHDFEEVNHTGFITQDGQPVGVEYQLDGKPLEKNPGPVGEIRLDGAFSAVLEQIEKLLPATEFKSGVMESIRSAYAAGVPMGKAFAKFLQTLFPESGLVFLSPNDPQVKRILSPLFVREIEHFPSVSQLIIRRSAELEERYHAQIKPRALNLFCLFKGGRYLIEPREHDFSLKGTRQFYTKDELLTMARETPEMLSPNVALRPVCQDTILPTAVYVGGPSEIAYFAQLKPVYEFFGMGMPVVYPRASVTILEEKHDKVVGKFQIELEDLFDNPEKVAIRALESISDVKTEDLFTDATSRIHEILGEMRFGIQSIDPTLLTPLETTQEKIDALLQILRDRTSEAQKRKHETALRQVSKVAHFAFPDGMFQERMLNVTYFLNKYGFTFMEMLSSELQVGAFRHQVLKL